MEIEIIPEELNESENVSLIDITIYFYPADDQDFINGNLLWSENLSIIGDHIPATSIYHLIKERCNVPKQNIIPYFKTHCLPYDQKYGIRITSLLYRPTYLKINLAFSLPKNVGDNLLIKLCQNVAVENRIPIIEDIYIKDRYKDEIIYTVYQSLTSHTTIRKLKEELARHFRTKESEWNLVQSREMLRDDVCVADLFYVCECEDVFKNSIEIISEYIEPYTFGGEGIPFTKSPRFIMLSFVSKETLIDIIKIKAVYVECLKNYIRKEYKIPVEHQQLLHNNELIGDKQRLYGLHKKDINHISIALVVRPFYIDVKFDSDYIKILQSDELRKFSGMATIKEIKETVSEITGVEPKALFLLNRYGSRCDHELKDEEILHEIRDYGLDYGPNHSVEIKVFKSILFDVIGEEPFRLYIRDKYETIGRATERFYRSWPSKELVLIKQSDKNFNMDTPLLDLVDDNRTLTFDKRSKQNKQPEKPNRRCQIS